jgi:hypothetical protein
MNTAHVKEETLWVRFSVGFFGWIIDMLDKHLALSLLSLSGVFVLAFSALFNLNANQVAVLVGIIAIIAFLVWCRSAHVHAANRRPSGSLVVVTRRLIWMHVKLALWMTLVLGFFMFLFSEKSKKENPGLNHPVETVFQVIATLFAPIALGVVFFISYLYDDHRVVFNLGALALYLMWLLSVTDNMVKQEYSDRRTSLWLAAMVPWVLIAALVMISIPWRGAADQPCYHGCTAAEAAALPMSVAIHKGELRGKVTINHGEPQGISLEENCRGGHIPDGTYEVDRIDGNGQPSEQGNYLHFYPRGGLQYGVNCADMRP